MAFDCPAADTRSSSSSGNRTLAKPSASSRAKAIVTLPGSEETARSGVISEVGVEPPVLSEQLESPPASNTVDNAASAALRFKCLCIIALASSDSPEAWQG